MLIAPAPLYTSFKVHRSELVGYIVWDPAQLKAKRTLPSSGY
jgi:hypothetical protein